MLVSGSLSEGPGDTARVWRGSLRLGSKGSWDLTWETRPTLVFILLQPTCQLDIGHTAPRVTVPFSKSPDTLLDAKVSSAKRHPPF